MSQEDNEQYVVPFSTDESGNESNGEATFDESPPVDPQPEIDPQEDDDPQLIELAQPFVGQWNDLISTTNWEKGRIIGDWRQALIESGAASSQYSDDAWARRVGGVTAPHVGRLRRVFERFESSYKTYEGLYWSHFLAALDWDDAPLWLEGAVRESWSVARMREQRWQAHGAVDDQRPTNSQIIEVDTDEDVVLPAQGGGRTKEYGDEPGVAPGPVHEGADFGEEELTSMPSGADAGPKPDVAPPPAADVNPSQPFAGLPELPDDLADVIEDLKLTILRHKTTGWEDVSADTIQRYLDAITVMLRSEV
ncbi:MAG: hypothetical protein AAGG48_26825 [Planctomycetota bacterium]